MIHFLIKFMFSLRKYGNSGIPVKFRIRAQSEFNEVWGKFQRAKPFHSCISQSEETVASTSHNLEFVNCGETIKEEIKEEVEEEYQRDPLRFTNAVQSLDEPVTYEEFICEG